MTKASSGSSERPRRHLIQVVGRACDILSLLHCSEQPLKLAEICARLGLAPPTAFRVIDTLCAKGLVERPGHSGYRIVGLAPRERHFRLGYAAQSSEFAFSRTTAHSMEAGGESSAHRPADGQQSLQQDGGAEER